MFDSELILNKLELFWQYPVITEQEFYNQNKFDENYIGLPWATIIDKKINLNFLYKSINNFLKKQNYYTCCQHISFRKLIPIFKNLGIKTIYCPHKIIGENKINGIIILPCPLYAVNFEDKERNNVFQNIDLLNQERLLLYSFIGGYQQQYLTDIRLKIFKMKHYSTKTIIEHTGDWHFNKIVYSEKQNIKKELNENDNHKNKTKKYNQILLNSRFSLCPSGSGPNSIRFWESLAIGAIPILLSDKLELPYNIDWDNTIVRIKEKDIENIENILKNITIEKEKEMRINCIKIYNRLRNNYKNIDNYKK